MARRHLAVRVAPFGLGVPVVGLLAGMLILGERVTGWQWLGVALVISALASVIAGSWLRSGPRSGSPTTPGRPSGPRDGMAERSAPG